MSSDISATSRHRPSRADVARVVGLVVPGVTHNNGRVDRAWELRDHGGDTVVVIELGPGEHHLGDGWLTGVEAMRTDGARRLAVVTAGAIALLGDGVLHDEDYELFGGGTLAPGDVLREMIRHPETSQPGRRIVARQDE